MVNLKDSHRQIHEKFAQQGAHVIRTNQRYCADLWPDLIIEQVLMKSLKSWWGVVNAWPRVNRKCKNDGWMTKFDVVN